MKFKNASYAFVILHGKFNDKRWPKISSNEQSFVKIYQSFLNSVKIWMLHIHRENIGICTVQGKIQHKILEFCMKFGKI